MKTKSTLGVFIAIGLIFCSNFSNQKALFYYLAVTISVLGLLLNQKLLKFPVRIYSILITLPLLSIFGGYFDFKNALNQLGFILVGLFISTNEVLINNSQRLKSRLRIFFQVILIIIIYGYLIAWKDIINLDVNTFFRKVYESTGLFKQEFGQLIAVSILTIYLHISSLKSKINKWGYVIVVICIIPLIIGARSILFGFLALLLIQNAHRFKLKQAMLAFLIFIFHLILPFIIKKSSALEFFYQIDPRWGMQYIAVTESENHPLGIGFFGWNEYVNSNKRDLLNYTKYLPDWLGYTKNEYIPTTLESSLFQLIVEIGFFPTILIYITSYSLYQKLTKKSLNPFEKVITYSFLVITFSSFYEDNIFQPIWHLVFCLTLLIYSVHEKKSSNRLLS